MRQVLIIKGIKDKNILVVNLPESEVYAIEINTIEIIDGANKGAWQSELRFNYSHKTLIINLIFEDYDDVSEFESMLLEYLRNAATPIMSEGDKHEIRYWMDIEVLEVKNVCF